MENDGSAPTLNYGKTVELFKVKIGEASEAQLKEIEEFETVVKSHGSMNLDQKCEVPQVLFASLMRSGNTFFRKLLENITGIDTGSNLTNGFTLNFMLMAQGLKGEGYID